jgi:hypothetical protein
MRVPSHCLRLHGDVQAATSILCRRLMLKQLTARACSRDIGGQRASQPRLSQLRVYQRNEWIRGQLLSS